MHPGPLEQIGHKSVNVRDQEMSRRASVRRILTWLTYSVVEWDISSHSSCEFFLISVLTWFFVVCTILVPLL